MSEDKPIDIWRGELGTAYARDSLKGEEQFIENARLDYRHLLTITNTLKSVIEFGCGTGHNLAAFRSIDPHMRLCGVEANRFAVDVAHGRVPEAEIHHTPAQDFVPQDKFDLVLTRGFLIHVPTDVLPDVLARMYQSAAKFILMGEHFAAEPAQELFRRRHDLQWARNFPGEMHVLYPDLLFVAEWAPKKFVGDGVHWILLQKPD
jgi:pseudaminic acid biosynthesis-associated methylase